MQPDIAQAILQFMSRVQLNAQEIQAYQACIAALQGIIEPVDEDTG